MKQKITITVPPAPETSLALSGLASSLRAQYPEAEIVWKSTGAMQEIVALIPGVDRFEEDPQVGEALHVFCEEGDSCHSLALPEWQAYWNSQRANPLGNPFHTYDLAKRLVGFADVDTNYEIFSPEGKWDALPPELGQAGTLKIALCAESLAENLLPRIVEAAAGTGIATEIFIIGTVSAKRKSRSLAGQSGSELHVQDLCGRLSFQEIAETCRSCDMAICGPGTTALLAAGYGTFTICIDAQGLSLGGAYPYGHGHLVLQSQSGKEIEPVLQGVLQEILRNTLTGADGNVPSLDQWQSYFDSHMDTFLGKIRVFGTQRMETRSTNASARTELQIRPLVFLGADTSDVLRAFYRLLWEQSLDQRNVSTNETEILQQDTTAALCELLRPLEQMYELANFGATYSTYIRNSLLKNDLDRARQDSTRLQEVEDLLNSLASTFPALQPLASYHASAQELLCDEKPENLAQEMTTLFSDLKNRVLVLLDLMNTLFHTTFQAETANRPSANEEVSDG